MKITKTEVFELKECLSIYFTSVSGSFLLRCQMEIFSMRERERDREREREIDIYIYILYIFMFTDLSCDFKPRAICGTYLARVCNDIFWSAGCWLFQVWVGYVMFRHFFAQQLYAAWTRTRSLRRSKFIIHIIYTIRICTYSIYIHKTGGYT